MPSSSVLNAKQATGTVHEGTDKTGKRYKYVAGQRGRVKLNLSPQQKAGLKSAGVTRPGTTYRFKGKQLKAMGINPRAQGMKSVQQQQTSIHMRNAVNKMLASHAKWKAAGDGDVTRRLSKLLSNGRDKLLSQGNKSEVHKAFAAVVLGTIFNKGVKAKSSGTSSGAKVVFNPGGRGVNGFIAFKDKSGKETGRIEFGDITKIQDKHIAGIREQFEKLRNPAPTHKDKAAEHKAMVEAFNVKPPEQLTGGKGDKKPDEEFNKKSLTQGMKVESEHTDNPQLAKEIAKDHLTEDPKYYNKLKKVEKPNAPETGKVKQGNKSKHQGTTSVGKTAKASGSNRSRKGGKK